MLVSEFTLTENPGNTTTSLLRVVCHANDSVILGTWLQETDHRTIEDQVSQSSFHFIFIIPCIIDTRIKVARISVKLMDSVNV